MPLENEKVSRTELELQFSNINESVKDIKKILEKMDNRQQEHFGSLKELNKDIGYIKEEIAKNKTNHEKEISVLWEELNRREKKRMWIVGTIISVAVLIMGGIKYL